MNMMKFKFLILAICALSAIALSSCDKDSDSSDDIIAKNKETKEAGEAFLAENRIEAGVVETYTGLQYKIDSLGTGAKPVPTDSVTLEFVGKLTNGRIFSTNTETLLLSAQIKGFQQGLRYMPEGSKFTLYIPYYLAYGVNGRSFKYKGEPITVGAYSAVIFDCHLISVKHNQ